MGSDQTHSEDSSGINQRLPRIQRQPFQKAMGAMEETRGSIYLLWDDHDGTGGGNRILEGLPWKGRVLTMKDWNRDLSPWPAPGVFRGEEDFSGGGPAFLEKILDSIRKAPDYQESEPRILCGYSLAGLFALWAGTCTNLFSGIACMSGSLWYDHWTDYLRIHPCRARSVVLSLGDREIRTRNPRMITLGKDTEEVQRILENQGVTCRFRWERGNHFQDAEGRVRRGLQEVLEMEKRRITGEVFPESTG